MWQIRTAFITWGNVSVDADQLPAIESGQRPLEFEIQDEADAYIKNLVIGEYWMYAVEVPMSVNDARNVLLNTGYGDQNMTSGQIASKAKFDLDVAKKHDRAEEIMTAICVIMGITREQLEKM